MAVAKSKRLKRIPKFKSLAEEIEFWETHDSTEYFDDSEMMPLAALLKGVQLVHIYVAPDGTRYQIKKLPKKQKPTYHPPRTETKKRKAFLF